MHAHHAPWDTTAQGGTSHSSARVTSAPHRAPRPSMIAPRAHPTSHPTRSTSPLCPTQQWGSARGSAPVATTMSLGRAPRATQGRAARGNTSPRACTTRTPTAHHAQTGQPVCRPSTRGTAQSWGVTTAHGGAQMGMLDHLVQHTWHRGQSAPHAPMARAMRASTGSRALQAQHRTCSAPPALLGHSSPSWAWQHHTTGMHARYHAYRGGTSWGLTPPPSAARMHPTPLMGANRAHAQQGLGWVRLALTALIASRDWMHTQNQWCCWLCSEHAQQAYCGSIKFEGINGAPHKDYLCREAAMRPKAGHEVNPSPARALVVLSTCNIRRGVLLSMPVTRGSSTPHQRQGGAVASHRLEARVPMVHGRDGVGELPNVRVRMPSGKDSMVEWDAVQVIPDLPPHTAPMGTGTETHPKTYSQVLRAVLHPLRHMRQGAVRHRLRPGDLHM